MSRTYLHAELHNHTTESDGALSVEELVQYARQEAYDVLALTDHNTTAGQGRAIAAAEGSELAILPGLELTTMYGHVLALGMTSMMDWSDLHPQFPDAILDRLRRHGARAVGIAHPFCVGEPIMTGCRFSMQIRDLEKIDYIEVFNTSGPDWFLGNEQALAWWQKLVLAGYPLAACTGIDLHHLPVNKEVFTTFVPVQEGLTKQEMVLAAILQQRTIVSRGPLLEWEEQNGCLHVTISDTCRHPYAGACWTEDEPVLVTMEDNTGALQRATVARDQPADLPLSEAVQYAVLKAYRNEAVFDQLLCVLAPYRRRKQA